MPTETVKVKLHYLNIRILLKPNFDFSTLIIRDKII